MKPGGRLESLILKTADYLARNQIARIWKWPVEAREVRKTKQCRCGRAISSKEILYAGRTGFDFFGYTAKGRVVAIEAKEVEADRLPWGVKSGSGLKIHQLDALREVERAGGIAFVLWMMGGRVGMLFPNVLVAGKSVPWECVRDVVQYEDRIAITVELLADWPAPHRSP